MVLVEPLDSKDLAHLTLLDRKELGITFTKVLQCMLTIVSIIACSTLQLCVLINAVHLPLRSIAGS